MKLRKWVKWTLFIVGLAVYLNIGWAFGTYQYNNVAYKSVESGSLFDKFLAGPGHLVNSPNMTVENQVPLSTHQIVNSLFWSAFILLLAVVWIGYFVYYLLWLIFAGGIAKLFGYG